MEKLNFKTQSSSAYVPSGFILTICTLTLPFFVCYNYFFDHTKWLNNKILLRWLRNNQLPDPSNCGSWLKWEIDDDTSIYYCGEKGSRTREFVVYHKNEIIFTDHSMSLLDTRLSKRISKILINEVEGEIK